jgi:hypothetical protein
MYSEYYSIPRERNRIQARKTRNKNKSFLKSLQDEITALKTENTMLKTRVKTLEESVATAAAVKEESEMNVRYCMLCLRILSHIVCRMRAKCLMRLFRLSG